MTNDEEACFNAGSLAVLFRVNEQQCIQENGRWETHSQGSLITKLYYIKCSRNLLSLHIPLKKYQHVSKRRVNMKGVAINYVYFIFLLNFLQLLIFENVFLPSRQPLISIYFHTSVFHNGSNDVK